MTINYSVGNKGVARTENPSCVIWPMNSEGEYGADRYETDRHLTELCMIWKGRPLAGIRAGMEPGALRFAVNAEGLPETVVMVEENVLDC